MIEIFEWYHPQNGYDQYVVFSNKLYLFSIVTNGTIRQNNWGYSNMGKICWHPVSGDKLNQLKAQYL